MNLAELIQHALDDALHRSLPALRPELTLCATIVALLLVRMIVPRWQSGPYWVALLGAATALALLEPWRWLDCAARQPVEIFTGMLVVDGLSVFLRGLLLAFLALLVLLTWITAVPPRDDATELFVLVLGATLGMCMMVSANHLVMVVLGMEMASLPCYVLAGILKFHKPSTEAALKFAVFGAGAAGIMLYGISLLAGVLGSLHLPTLAAQLVLLMQTGPSAEAALLLALGGLMLSVGLAFKLSAVPFHFWAPDVFEGAPAEVGALLSVASKAAAVGLLVRLALGLTAPATTSPPAPSRSETTASTDGAPTMPDVPSDETAHSAGPRRQQNRVAAEAAAPQWYAAQALAAVNERRELRQPVSASPLAAEDNRAVPVPRDQAALVPVRRFVVGLLSLLAVVTCTFGNLAAYGQSNMKRMLAYSTIAHAGYLIMPVAAAVALSGGLGAAASVGDGVSVEQSALVRVVGDETAAEGDHYAAEALGQREQVAPPASTAPDAQFAVASVLFYLAVYMFMNLAAFAITAVLRNALGSEQIDDYAGLVRYWPALVVCTAVAMFSLVGLPPLAGFLAKFYIFAAVVKAELWLLLAVGGLNTVLSLFYYLRVVRVMALRHEGTEPTIQPSAARWLGGLYCIGVTLPLVALFLWSNKLMQWSIAAAAGMF